MSATPIVCGVLRVQGSGFRVQGSGCRVQGSGFRVQGLRFMVQGPGSRVQGSGFRVQGSGFSLNAPPTYPPRARCDAASSSQLAAPASLLVFTSAGLSFGRREVARGRLLVLLLYSRYRSYKVLEP